MSLPDDDEILKMVSGAHKRARSHSSGWRERAAEDYAYYSGDQWADEDLQVLRDQLRPAITFNRIGPVVDVVSGSEVSNRQEVRFIPREIGDAGVNEVLTGAAKWVRDLCDAEDEESDAFLDCLICGMGWTETHLEHDEDPDGRIYIDRRDPLEMYWDPAARKHNLSDSRWVQRRRRLSVEEFKQVWPDADLPSDASEWMVGEDDAPATQIDDDDYGAGGTGGDKLPREGKITVLEHQWWTLESTWRVADPQGGGIVEIPPARYEKMKEALAGVPAAKVKRRKYWRAFVAGNTVVAKEDAPCDAFTYRAICGKRDRNEGTWYGLVRAMKDPQMWANKFFSQILHILNSNAKGGLLAEEGVFANQREAELNWARPDGIVVLKAGGLSRLREKTMAQMPTGFAQALEYAVKSIPDVTGVNLELLGMAGRDQPGILEYQRKQAGLTILATLFDALRRYRKEQGRVLLHFIRNYISDGRLVRIVGDTGAQFVPLVKDQSTGDYDVVIDDSPTSPNQKERVFQVISQLLPTLAKMNVMPPADILDYAPLPATLVEKWKQSLTKPDPMKQAASQIAVRQAAAEAAKTESETRLNTGKLRQIRAGMAVEAERLNLDEDKAVVDVVEKVLQSSRPQPARGGNGST
mgnify:FL=1